MLIDKRRPFNQAIEKHQRSGELKDFFLRDRSVILTGPLSTFNQSIARTFTQQGANVALLDRNINAAERYASQLSDEHEINEKFGKAIAIEADLTKPHHVQDSISKAAEAFGSIDTYIDGLFIQTPHEAFSSEGITEDLERMISTHLRSPLLMTHYILKFLRARKRGRIIYLMHDHIRMGLPKDSLMAATRSSLTHFAKSLSREVSSDNITVNCLLMGTTEEYLINHRTDSESVTEVNRNLQSTAPWSNLMDPNRIANTAAFLAGTEAQGITGQSISVNDALYV